MAAQASLKARGAFDCRQLDPICEKRRFKALLE
jgi:hypothetical protein